MTTNQSWGWNRDDPHYRSPRELVQHLLTCVHNGGNYLLNVGPRGDGTLPRPAVRRLEAVGDWLQRHGDAVYATEPHPDSYALQHLTTSRGNTLYVPLHFYHGPATILAGLGNRVEAVSILGTGQNLSFSQEGNRLRVSGLPPRPPDRLFTVLELKLDGKPRGIPNPLSPVGNYD
jgi:alpha-L-fucosidase